MTQSLLKVAGLLATVSALPACGEAPEHTSVPVPTDVQIADTPLRTERDLEGAITCTYPVKPDDTGDTILERFGADARRETLENDGGPYPVVAIWPEDQVRRLEVTFIDDDARRKVRVLRIAGETPQWNIAGIRHGTKLAGLERRNGRPFEFYGFGWDFGGMVFDWNGGALDMFDGGCGVGVMIGDKSDSGEILPDELVGDRSVRSDFASLRTLDVEVLDLWISYP